MGIAEQIAKRLELCDKLHKENLEQIRKLKTESSKKFDGTNRHIRILKARLEENPGNNKIRKEYATMVNARAMFYAGNKINEAILKDHES